MFRNFRRGFLFEDEGADGADLHAFSALIADCFGNWLILESRYHSLKTSSGKANGSDTQTLPTYPDTPAAKNTLIGIVNKEGTAFIYGEIPLKLPKSLCLQFYAEMFSNFLKFTGSVF